MAATAVSILPWPEIITTGSSGCSCLIASSSCRPSSLVPCSQMSRKTRLGRRVAIAASASSLSRAVRVGIAFVLQDAGDQIADVGFVVDDENFSGPCGYSFTRLSCTVCGLGAIRLALRRRNAAAPRRRAGRGSCSAASLSSMPPPCSSRMRPTMARPRPVPFSRVVT